MSPEERRKVQVAVRRWRAAYPTPQARREAYLRIVPRQVAESMAFEGEPVGLEILEEHLRSLPRRVPGRLEPSVL